MQNTNKIKSRKIIKRLIKDHVSPYRKKLYIAVFFMIIGALCTAFVAGLVKPAIDEVFISHDRFMLIIIPLIIFVVYTIKGISEYIQIYYVKFVGQKILTDLQLLMYSHLLHSDILYISNRSSGKIISGFTNDIVLMRGTVSHGLVGIAKHLLSVIFLITTMFVMDPILSVLIFFVFPVAIYPIQLLGRRMRLVTDQSQEELSNFTSNLDETFNSIKIIKSFCMEEQESIRARKMINKILVFYNSSAKIDSLTSPIMETLSGLVIACIIWYGGFAVINGTMTAGALMAFIAAFISAYRPFKSLVSLNVSLQEGLAAANRVFNTLDKNPSVKNIINAKKIDFTHPKISFRNVMMDFDGKAALSNFNLVIEAGATYAIVGKSGSGKTTVANLLPRFFDPTGGKILIDDINIRDLDLTNLRNQISLVTQETMLFDSTVTQNISCNSDDIDMDKIEKAAKAADAHDFIQEMRNGYNTKIGLKGNKLSGGQRQRLAIARAFYKDAPILILDEATSSLDNNSEHAIIKAIAKLRENRTTLIITHRLTTVIDADKIIVMKDAVICEQGTHEELLKKNGDYHKLYNKELQERSNSV